MYGPRPIRFPAHWCADYSKYRGFLAGGISTASSLLPFLEHGSAAAKTLISHAHNTTSYAGQKFNISVCVLFLLLSRAFASRARTLHAHPRDNPKGLFGP